jgi:hypothetical protein
MYENVVDSEWVAIEFMGYNMHYCPNCYYYDDDDNIKLKQI